jgi:hypothetical protein
MTALRQIVLQGRAWLRRPVAICDLASVIYQGASAMLLTSYLTSATFWV